LVIGDVGALRAIAAKLISDSPRIAAMTLRAAESFDFEPLTALLDGGDHGD
jgi:hypothetical protein